MTTNLLDLFDLDDLGEMISEGYVKAQDHPSLPLKILNYSAAAQYGNVWNDVTRACRGLVYDRTSNAVVARPFPKFFNWDQMGAPKLPTGAVRVGPKMDGSLGVLYKAGDTGCTCHAYRIATRGSFTSDQALRGTDIFREMCEDAGFEPWEDRTYLFEIIYPENRIVVDYGERSTLVLLDVIDNATGKSDLAAFDDAMWFDKVTWTMVPEFDHRLIESIPDGEEGLVFYWHGNDVRVKMKAAEYVRLHRIVTNTSTRTIWEVLAQGGNIEKLLENVPDEFYSWVHSTVASLRGQYGNIELDCLHELARIQEHLDQSVNSGSLDSGLTPAEYNREYRKLFAAQAKKFEHSDVLFRMIDGRPYDDAIWKRLRPAYSKPFAEGEES